MSEVSKIRADIAKLKKSAHFGQAIKRLRKNKDFITVIEEGFLTNEAARHIRMATDPRIEESARDDARLMAEATGPLMRWLSMAEQMADHNANLIEQYEAEAEEADRTESEEG